MAIVKLMKDNLTKADMLTHSKGNSPRSINEIIMPDGTIINVERPRGVRIDQANEQAADFFENWSKDGLLARSSKKDTDKEFYPHFRNRSGKVAEWQHGGFTMTEAEGQAWATLSDEDKERFMEIIRETVRTDPTNPRAKRAVAFSDMHTNTKNKHVHWYAHAHLIDYSKNRPEVSASTINNHSYANSMNDALRHNLIEAGFDFINTREQPMIAQTVEATAVDLNEAGNIPSNERVKYARDMSPDTLAIEKLLEESNKRMAAEAERQSLLMNALSFSTKNAELESQVGKLTKEAELKDEKIEELETSIDVKIEAAKTELLTKFKSEMEELKKSHSEELNKITESNAEKVAALESERDEIAVNSTKFEDALKQVEPTIAEAKAATAAAEERATRAEGLLATVQSTMTTMQDTLKETFNSKIAELEALITEGDLDDLMLYRNKNSKLTDPQKIARGGKDVDYMVKYVEAFDGKLEAKKNTKKTKNTPKPRKP